MISGAKFIARVNLQVFHFFIDALHTFTRSELLDRRCQHHALPGICHLKLLSCTLSVNGEVVEFDAVVRIDTPGERLYYLNGGILQYVLRNMARS